MLEKHGLTGKLVAAVFLICFGSSFPIGYSLGILNLPDSFIKEFTSETILHEPYEQAKTRTGLITPEFLYAQVTTVFVVAGAIGAFSSGWIADIIGRRNGLLLNHAFAIVGGVCVGLCVATQNAALLFVGRALIGINAGVSMGIASIYLTEIAPQNLRGIIGATHQLSVTLGIVFSYLATMTFTLNTAELWPVAIAIGAVPPFISLIILPCLPESPRFMFLNKKNEVAARLGFAAYNIKESVDVLIGGLREEVETTKNQPKFKFSQLFTQRDLRMAVLIACLIQVMQQLSGINAVISYSSTMLELAGISDHYKQYCVTAIGVLNVIATIIALPLLERAGRRTLLLWPTVVLAASLLLLTIFVHLALRFENDPISKPLGIVSVILILIYICGFAMGLGPVPALIVSEIFRQGPRAAAYSLSQCIQFLSNLIVLFSYPSISKAIGGYSFLPFLVVVVVCWTFFFLFMPETKNRTFDDVANDLAFGHIVVFKRVTTLDYQSVPMSSKEGQRGQGHDTLIQKK